MQEQIEISQQFTNKTRLIPFYENRLLDYIAQLSQKITKLQHRLDEIQQVFKTRILVKYGDNLLFKNLNEVAYFYADDKLVYLVGIDGKKYLVDEKLEDLAQKICPKQFFRINRKLIVHHQSIIKIKQVDKYRLLLCLKPEFQADVMVSKERNSDFKNWLNS